MRHLSCNLRDERQRCASRLLWLAPLCALLLLLAGGTAKAQVLYYENFDDTTLEPNTTFGNGMIADGILSFNDTSSSTRARFVVRQTFNEPVMTFSFDVKAPAMNHPGFDNELVFRAGIGTADNTLSSSEFILEAILWRTSGGGTGGGNRGDYVNNGNETMFLVANNKTSPLTFPSPIDGSAVTLEAFQYIPFIKNNSTGDFGLLKPIDNFAVRDTANPPGTIVRMGIGNSSNAHQGTYAIDNVLVFSGVTFINPPSTVGLTLRVDPATGQTQLANNAGEPIAFNAYRITSAAGSLNPAGWNPISNQGIPGFPPGDGSGNGWEAPGGGGSPAGDANGNGTVDAADYVLLRKIGTALDIWRANFGATGSGPGGSPLELVEWYLQGESTLADGASIGLGQAYSVGGAQDLVFEFATTAGVHTGSVEYVALGGGSAQAQAVPEPAAPGLASLAIGCLFIARRRNKK